jgi:hypothetical protein
MRLFFFIMWHMRDVFHAKKRAFRSDRLHDATGHLAQAVGRCTLEAAPQD